MKLTSCPLERPNSALYSSCHRDQGSSSVQSFSILVASVLVQGGILLFAEFWPMRTRTTTAETAASANGRDRKMTCTNQIRFGASPVPVRVGQNSENSNSNERGRPASTVQSTAIVAPDHRLLHEKCGLLCGRAIAIEGGQHWRKTIPHSG